MRDTAFMRSVEEERRGGAWAAHGLAFWRFGVSGEPEAGNEYQYIPYATTTVQKIIYLSERQVVPTVNSSFPSPPRKAKECKEIIADFKC